MHLGGIQITQYHTADLTQHGAGIWERNKINEPLPEEKHFSNPPKLVPRGYILQDICLFM